MRHRPEAQGSARSADDARVAHHRPARIGSLDAGVRVRGGAHRRAEATTAMRQVSPAPTPTCTALRTEGVIISIEDVRARRALVLLAVARPLPRDRDGGRRPHGRAHLERAAEGARRAARAHGVGAVRAERRRPAAHDPLARAHPAAARARHRRRRRAHRRSAPASTWRSPSSPRATPSATSAWRSDWRRMPRPAPAATTCCARVLAVRGVGDAVEVAGAHRAGGDRGCEGADRRARRGGARRPAAHARHRRGRRRAAGRPRRSSPRSRTTRSAARRAACATASTACSPTCSRCSATCCMLQFGRRRRPHQPRARARAARARGAAGRRSAR